MGHMPQLLTHRLIKRVDQRSQLESTQCALTAKLGYEVIRLTIPPLLDQHFA